MSTPCHEYESELTTLMVIGTQSTGSICNYTYFSKQFAPNEKRYLIDFCPSVSLVQSLDITASSAT